MTDNPPLLAVENINSPLSSDPEYSLTINPHVKAGDPRSVEVLAVGYIVMRLLEEMREQVEGGEDYEITPFNQTTIDVVTEVFETFQDKLLPNTGSYRSDFDDLDGDTKRSVSEVIVPFGEVLGAEMTLDAADPSAFTDEELESAALARNILPSLIDESELNQHFSDETWWLP